MSGNSWEVKSYQQGRWQVSVRRNPENDRLDEGDYPEGQFYAQKIPDTTGEIKYNVFKDNMLVAEVRGKDIENRTIVPMRELDEEDEAELHRFLDGNL